MKIIRGREAFSPFRIEIEHEWEFWVIHNALELMYSKPIDDTTYRKFGFTKDGIMCMLEELDTIKPQI